MIRRTLFTYPSILEVDVPWETTGDDVGGKRMGQFLGKQIFP